MKVLYTDINAECCAWLGSRVEDGSLPAGDVLMADIRDVGAGHLAGYGAVHCFAGIGGLPLGLAWAGWPEWLTVVTGGFPCQDISSAGKGAGLAGKKSGLFWELLRVISLHRPLVFIVENVGALSRRGLDVVAAALGKAGYVVREAYRVGAWALGAPHERERWWIVGYRRADADAGCALRPDETRQSDTRRPGPQHDAEGGGCEGQRVPVPGREPSKAGADAGGAGASIADAAGSRRAAAARVQEQLEPDAERGGWAVPAAGPWRRADDEWMYAGPPVFVYRSGAGREERHAPAVSAGAGHAPGRPNPTKGRGWPVPVLPGHEQREWEFPRLHQRGMGDAVHGLSGRLADALNKCAVMALGNAVVPEVVAAVAGGIVRGVLEQGLQGRHASAVRTIGAQA